jgi:hypothetical protein
MTVNITEASGVASGASFSVLNPFCWPSGSHSGHEPLGPGIDQQEGESLARAARFQAAGEDSIGWLPPVCPRTSGLRVEVELAARA